MHDTVFLGMAIAVILFSCTAAANIYIQYKLRGYWFAIGDGLTDIITFSLLCTAWLAVPLILENGNPTPTLSNARAALAALTGLIVSQVIVRTIVLWSRMVSDAFPRKRPTKPQPI
jgi:hypothetical protein